MANTVIALKKSGTTSAAPLSLANGELAINYADGKLFYKNVTGSIVAITSGSASSNSFATINANGSLITAVSNNSTLTFVAGQNIGINSDIINDIITLDANLTPANNFSNTKLSNGTVTLAGSLTTTEQMYVNSQITITPLGGSEGGEIRLIGPDDYTDWSLDSYQNNFRVFTVTGSTVSNVNFFHAGAGSIRMGVNKADPAYTVDVAGDVNITGTYRVNGTPIASGAGMDYAYVNTSTTASNNYASVIAANNAVGANAWANTVGTAGNNYTNSVGSAGNNYASILVSDTAAAINSNASASYSSINSNSTIIGTAGNNYASILVANTSAAINSNASASYTAINNYATVTATSIGTAGNNYAITVGASSNTYANNTFLKLTAPSQTINGDLSITGNVFLLGNATSISANNLIVNDSLIYLAANNDQSDILDIGFVGHYSNGTANLHTGLYRDHATKQYFLFADSAGPEPETINDLVPYANGMINAVLNADLITSNLILGGANTIRWISAAYSTANAANAWANTKVDSITSNNTRIWANSTVTSGIEVVNIDLAQSGVTAGVYGNSSIIPIITVDTYGRVTSIANVATSGGGGGASVNVGNTAPASPTVGNLWWDTDSGRMYIYYTDADSSQWVDASPTQNPATVGGYYLGNRGAVGTIDALGDIFRVHSNTMTSNVTIPAGYNAIAAGPLTVQNGVNLTVGDGSRAVIV